MKHINKTTAELLTYAMMILSCIGVTISGILWVLTPMLFISVLRAYLIVNKMLKTRKISTMQIVKILCKAGYQTTVSDGGEIVAQSDGHMYSIMCHENGHIQFARRYKVPVAQITTLRLAAVHTMSEVYMAKVIVEKGSEDGTGFMVFSVETVCSSEKELKATIQQHMQTIDDAEQSQSQHADELMASQQQTVERKRIGFI